MEGETEGRGTVLARAVPADVGWDGGAVLGRVEGMPLPGVSFLEDGGGGRVDGVPLAGVIERDTALVGDSAAGGVVLARNPAGRGAALGRDSTAGGTVLGRSLAEFGPIAGLGRKLGGFGSAGGAVGLAEGSDLVGSGLVGSGLVGSGLVGSGLVGSGSGGCATGPSSAAPHSSSISSVVGTSDLNDAGAAMDAGFVSASGDGAALACVSAGSTRLLALGFLVLLLIALRRPILAQKGPG